MATILEHAIDTERGDAIAANALAMGEVPELRAFIVKVKRKNEIRVIFEALGFDSRSVMAQHAHLAEIGEHITAVPRCYGFSEEALQLGDLELERRKAQRRASENDRRALDLQINGSGAAS